MRTMVRWCEVVVVVMVVVMMMTKGCVGEYNMESYLCDDIPAICAYNSLPYSQNSSENVCGTSESYLSPEVCNCGYTCVQDLEEGDSCDTETLLTIPSRLCGQHLYCTPDSDDPFAEAHCRKNVNLDCVSDLLDYENQLSAGTLGPGMYKPVCDELGRYSPTQCTPGNTCYCVSHDKRRLFGEGTFENQEEMNCRCSRYWDDMEGEGFTEGLRCLPNGNFDALQCTSNDVCYCYDDDTGTLPYGPFTIASLTALPCYNPNIHNEDYDNPCIRSQKLWDSQGAGDMVVVAERDRPVCSPDGYFAPVQYKGPTAYCADINGNPIQDYSLPIHLASTMTCNCARRQHMMENNDQTASKPLCCSSGEFYPWQQRGLLAYCVDENGNQVYEDVPFTDKENLKCYTPTPCAVNAYY